ncbi:ABC transporter substrate-binding protein [Streptomyces sp. NPDC002144]|uniref:ABC transporter substrate-binding protein n=1 Tax=Streptomyces sp. NPDC006668 TaxID=3156903 RepID=UPI0033F5D3E3
MTRPFRLLVILVALLLVAAGGLVAAWTQRDEAPVTILGTWTGTQEKHFEKVLRGFGIPFTYQGTAAQREVLLSKVQAGESPDIVIMPGVGELGEYADQQRLHPLGDLYDQADYGAPWGSAGKRKKKVYWVPVKADLKSVVWYRSGHRPALSPAPLKSWCIGMGDDGASGWPGSDWIEDLVLQRAGPGVYARWALGDRSVPWTDSRVRDAWEVWGRLLRQSPSAARHALLTDHRGEQGGDGLLFAGWNGCALEHQGSFARSFYNKRSAELTDSAPLLPGGPYPVRAHEVTGDFAALFSDRPQAKKLIEKLASREGQRVWAGFQDVFSANRRVPPKSDRVGHEISEQLTGGGTRCLDASDVMAPAVRDAFYEAALMTLSRAATGADLGIRGLLRDLQRVQDAQSPSPAGPETVCSTP